MTEPVTDWPANVKGRPGKSGGIGIRFFLDKPQVAVAFRQRKPGQRVTAGGLQQPVAFIPSLRFYDASGMKTL